MKASEKSRRRKAFESCQRINEARSLKAKVKKIGVMEPIGRRIIDLALIAKEVWCDTCVRPLSFRFMEEEKQFGLDSQVKVRCDQCLGVYTFHLNEKMPHDESEVNPRPLSSINCKAALGCLDTGIGTEQLNKLLSVMNVPTVDCKTLKRAEEVIGPLVVQVARESCIDAIAEEKRLTLSAQRSH